ncbi:universal stress protein PHOS32-like [Carex rostrata]
MSEHRTIGIGMDYSPSSKTALKWAVENIARAGDHIVLIHTQPHESHSAQKQLWEEEGSPLIPLKEFQDMHLQVQYGFKPDADILAVLDAASTTKEVTIVSKIYWGDAREKLCDAANDLKLTSLVVGSRGLGPLKRVLLGSVSNYVVLNASCPVTVVKAA